MPSRTPARLAAVLLVLASFLLPAVAHAQTAREGDRWGALALRLGPGWGSPARSAGNTVGFGGAVRLQVSLTRTLGGGVDACFWTARKDTIETDLVVAGPSLTWQPLERGPVLSVVLGLAYDHEIHNLLSTSFDDRLDGQGLGVGIGQEFAVARTFRVGPHVEYCRLWLSDGASASFVNVTVSATWRIPRD